MQCDLTKQKCPPGCTSVKSISDLWESWFVLFFHSFKKVIQNAQNACQDLWEFHTEKIEEEFSKIQDYKIE